MLLSLLDSAPTIAIARRSQSGAATDELFVQDFQGGALEDTDRPQWAEHLRRVARGLQQAPGVIAVTTAEQLQAAVVAGQPHIELRDHLDLSTLDFPGEVLQESLLGRVPPTVRSIRVRR